MVYILGRAWQDLHAPIAKLVVLINLQQQLPTRNHGTKLDTSQKCTWELSVKAVGLLWWWCQPVLQHGCTKVRNTSRYVVGAEIISTRLREGHSDYKSGLDMSLYHDIRLLACKKAKSLRHLNHCVSVIICTCDNLERRVSEGDFSYFQKGMVVIVAY